MSMDALITLFRFPCPTSSATRAQVWFELRSSGLRVLAIGLAIAVLIFVLFALGIPFAPFRFFTMLGVFGAVPAMMIFGGNAFGIRRGQKRAYVSAFEATQPCGTAQLAGIKLLVRTACMLVALAAIGLSVWASTSLVSEWGPWMSADGQRNLSLPLLQLRGDLAREFFGGSGYELAAQWLIVPIAVALMVAALAAFAAFRARYPRRLLVVLLFCALLVGLAIASKSLPNAIRTAIWWSVAATVLLTTVNLLRSGFAERALTPRYVCGALVISVAYFVACLPARNVLSVLVTLFLPLMICVLAPWSLSRIRHT
jgi:hypothetical protein